MHLDPAKKNAHRKGRRKINIEFITDKSRRLITFSKRKAGIMKKAYELATLTGTQVLLLVASETGHVYTFATPKLQPLITKPEGKSFIQSCLNTPDEDGGQEFEIIRSKPEVGDYGDDSYGLPPQYEAPGHQQQYFGSPYPPHYPGNGDSSRHGGYGSPGGHYPPPRDQYEYSDYPGEYRGDYPGDFQGHPPPGPYPGRRLSYPETGRGAAYPPGPVPHHSHGLPHEHPSHHSGYHPDYARDYPQPPQADYRGFPPSHAPYPESKYHDYGRPDYDRPEMQNGFDGPPGQGMDMHQNGYMQPEHHVPHDHAKGEL